MKQKTEIAAALGTTYKRIDNWFNNRRSICTKQSGLLSTKDIKKEPVTPTSSVTSFDFPITQQDDHPTHDTIIYIRTAVYDEFMPQYVWYTY